MCSSVVKIDSVNLDKVTYFINGVGLSSADVDVKTDIETNKVHIVTSKPKQSFCNVAVDDLPFQFEFKHEIEVDIMFDVSKTEVVAKNGFIIVTVPTAEGRITKDEMKFRYKKYKKRQAIEALKNQDFQESCSILENIGLKELAETMKKLSAMKNKSKVNINDLVYAIEKET